MSMLEDSDHLDVLKYLNFAQKLRKVTKISKAGFKTVQYPWSNMHESTSLKAVIPITSGVSMKEYDFPDIIEHQIKEFDLSKPRARRPASAPSKQAFTIKKTLHSLELPLELQLNETIHKIINKEEHDKLIFDLATPRVIYQRPITPKPYNKKPFVAPIRHLNEISNSINNNQTSKLTVHENSKSNNNISVNYKTSLLNYNYFKNIEENINDKKINTKNNKTDMKRRTSVFRYNNTSPLQLRKHSPS